MYLGYLQAMIVRGGGFSAHRKTAFGVAIALGLAFASQATGASTKTHSLLASRNLWTTLDICAPADRPHTVGIRGSMPSDGHRKDLMYMRFQLQYLDSSTQKWVDLGPSADSGFVELGGGAVSVRQAGRTFELVASSSTYTLRGYVEFQWRREGKAVHAGERTTTAGHTSLAGADPQNFSAATCVIG
jgi:hypothetical protein